MSRWWRGTWLVLRRNLLENLRSRTYQLITGVLLLMSVAVVVLPQVFGDEETVYTLAVVGEPSAELRAMLEAAEAGGDFSVELDSLATTEEIRTAVKEGDATAGLVEDRLFVSTEADGTFPVLVSQAFVVLESRDRMSDAGLTPEQIADVQSVGPP